MKVSIINIQRREHEQDTPAIYKTAVISEMCSFLFPGRANFPAYLQEDDSSIMTI